MFDNAAGEYKIAIQYFDLNAGASTYDLLINNKTIAQWTADMTLPSGKLDGHTSTRYTLDNIHLIPGDTITLRGTPQGGEPAPVDYIEITPVSKL
jgi:alpha-glucuronidase